MAGSEGSKLDRELRELLEELRVALPGPQLLLGFLLIVPFQQMFQRVDDAERFAYVVALCATTLAIVLLIAPTALHRSRFRDHDKERLLRWSTRLALWGIAATAVGTTAAVYLVTAQVTGNVATGLITGAVAGAFVVFWAGLPVIAHVTQRRADRRSRTAALEEVEMRTLTGAR